MKKFAGILYTDGNKILLLKRATGEHKGKWDIPGGRIEKKESPFEAAKRESEEEIGVVEGTKIHEFKNPFVYLFKIRNPFKVKLNLEHKKSKWVELDEVKKLDLHPSLKENLKSYLRKINELLNDKSFKEWLAIENNNCYKIHFTDDR